MGSPSEGEFLSKLNPKLNPNLELHALELPDGGPKALEDFYKKLESINPHIIYGYSLGGRVALDYLSKSEKKCETLILESVSFGISQEDLRQARVKQDFQRAKLIKENLKTFLEDWYDLDLWGELTSSQKNDLITKRLDQWKERTDLLSQMIVNYSPGNMSSVSRKTIETKIIYIYGSQDLKYKEIAQKLEDVSLIEVQNSGHNVHEYNAQKIIQKLQTYL